MFVMTRWHGIKETYLIKLLTTSMLKMMSFSPHRSCTLYKNNMRSIVKNKYLKTIYIFPLSSFLKAQIKKTTQIMIEETSKRFWGVTRTTSVGADKIVKDWITCHIWTILQKINHILMVASCNYFKHVIFCCTSFFFWELLYFLLCVRVR